MISSMTAFARSEQKTPQGNLVLELRSINHRYLEISFSMPEFARSFEMEIREKLRSQLKRGKIDCLLRYQATNNTEEKVVQLNRVISKNYCDIAAEIKTLLNNEASISATDIMRMPGVIENPEVNVDEIKTNIFTVMTTCLDDLISARAREGEGIATFLIERMDAVDKLTAQVKTRIPFLVEEQKERLRKRVEDAKLELSNERLELEIVIFSQRIDISEEVDRLQTHVKEVRRVIKEGGAVGRRLDFLMQELNREANTIGSKSIDTITSHAAVDLKVLIEQMREQVQNIE